MTGPLCVAGSSGGNLLTSTDLAAGPGRWLERNGGGSVQITGVSCPSAVALRGRRQQRRLPQLERPDRRAGAWVFSNVLPYVPTPEFVPPPERDVCRLLPLELLLRDRGGGGEGPDQHQPVRGPEARRPVGKRVRRPKRPRTILARVDGKRAETGKRGLRVKFRFYAVGGARRFICKRDLRRYRPCRSPVKFWAGRGKHFFRVRAIGMTGLKGPVALDRFRIRPWATPVRLPASGPAGRGRSPEGQDDDYEDANDRQGVPFG